jgi:hypothetical protein
MKVLQHPILCGLAVEVMLVAVFLIFFVGPCNAPIPGLVVLFLHWPAAICLRYALPFTSDWQRLILSPLVMTAVWISLFYVLRHYFADKAQEIGKKDCAA